MSGILTAYYGGAYATLVLDITGKASPNIPSLLSAAGWVGVAQPVRIVNTGLLNTLVLPSSLAGASLYVFLGAASLTGGVKSGGTAIRTQVPVTIERLGKIYGGGGKGGDGGASWAAYDPPTYTYAYAGAAGGAGGAGQGFDSASALTISDAAAAGPASTNTVTGSDGFGGGAKVTTVEGGVGGSGGAWGVAGSAGGTGGWSGDAPSRSGQDLGYAGGLAGYYIDGNDLVTWVGAGDCRGRVKA